MAITFFGSATKPNDNTTNSAIPTSVTPPASMVAGDLVVCFVSNDSSAGTMSVSNTGGQTWSNEAQGGGTGIRVNAFWCQFDGTWDADPSFTSDTAVDNGFSVQMLVFRPTSGSNTWSVDVSRVQGAFGTPGGTPPTVTITGITPTAASTVSVAAWFGSDDNVFSSLAGSGWDATGLSQQYRNTSGNDHSAAYAYKIQTSAAATGDVSRDMYETDGTTASGNGGAQWIMAFAESGGGGGDAVPQVWLQYRQRMSA